MPLFGPNIKKLKERGNIQELLNELKNKNPEIRVEVVKALTELGHIDGLVEAMENDFPIVCIESTRSLGKLRNVGVLADAVLKSNKPEVRISAAQILKDIGDNDSVAALVNAFTTMMRFGDWEDQVEMMMVISGRISTSFAKMAFMTDRQEALNNIRGPAMELRHFQGLLDKVIAEGKDPFSKWFALLTLIELGDRRDEILQTLTSFSTSYTNKVDSALEAKRGQSDFSLYVVANETNCLIRETMRALAFFKGNATAAEIVIKILDGDLLCGSYIHESYSHPYLHPGRQENAICALGALGDSTTRERLEYLAARGNSIERKCAAVALACFGKANYDEIKSRVESQ